MAELLHTALTSDAWRQSGHSSADAGSWYLESIDPPSARAVPRSSRFAGSAAAGPGADPIGCNTSPNFCKLSPFLKKPLRVGAMLESRDDILTHRCRPAAVRLLPWTRSEGALLSLISGQGRLYLCPWSTGPHLRLRPLLFLGYPCQQPFLDQAQNPAAGDAVLDELDRPFVRQVVEVDS